MLMFLFKSKTEFCNNYANIYDVKNRKLILVYLILFIFLINSIFFPVPNGYLKSVSIGYKLKSIDNVYDYILPLCSAFTIIYAFFNDYSSSTYQMIIFLNRNKYNYIVLYRWLLYVATFCIGSVITGMIYYRNISFLNLTNLLLSVRFIPNILFLSSLVLLMATLFKNIYLAVLTLASYYCVDLFSSGHIFKLLSIGAHANNFYYNISPEYYFLNRILLLGLSSIFLFVSCKSSSKD